VNIAGFLPASSGAPQLGGALFGLRRDVAQFVGNLEGALDLVLGCVVGALGALGQSAGALEPERQLMLDPMRRLVSVPVPHRSNWLNFQDGCHQATSRLESQIDGKIERIALEARCRSNVCWRRGE
jgi:hypothetical protein